MPDNFEIISVDASNVDQHGFFCYMSKPKTPGYQQKLEWVKARFTEGMHIKMIHEIGGRTVGFIEYIPGEYAWRAVNAPRYMVIHCIWVVGRGKGKGYGTHLVQMCLDDAKGQGKHGVAMITTDRIWLAKSKLFLKNGFVEVDQAPPCFHLLVKQFGDAPLPSFPTDWDERQVKFGPGLTVIRTPQCPYGENAVNEVRKFVQENDIEAKVVEMHSAKEVQTTSPSAYGVFSVVLDDKLFSYHYLQRRDYARLLTLMN